MDLFLHCFLFGCIYNIGMPKDPVEKMARELAKHCLAARIRLLSRVVSGIYESRIRVGGITIGQMNMMAALLMMGSQANSTLLGQVLCMEKSTVSRNLKKMVERNWIQKKAEEKGGKGGQLRVTSLGKRVFKKAFSGWKKAQKVAEERLGEDLVSALLGSISMEGKVSVKSPKK